MNDTFDELTKALAQSDTRRGALKQFGLGLGGFALASFGLARRVHAEKPPFNCNCTKPLYGCVPDPNDPNYLSACYYYCDGACKAHVDKHGHCC